MRFIVSTIGTSTLTNSINRENQDEAKNWGRILGMSANLKEDELSDEAKQVMKTLAERAQEKLSQNDVATNRRASAELNGIYGIYGGSFLRHSNDQHYLICTDTAQGQQTGKLIKDFLTNNGFSTVHIVTPAKLSTKDTNAFSDGTKELIKWLEEFVPKPPSSYEVIFNLVGGFKSLQGYMNTFGAFYADEVIYIFESSTDLIRIPRLPIKIDTSVIENNLVKFAMMAADEMYPIEQLEGVPETLLELVADNGNTFAGLSAWGTLIWNRTKADLLYRELLSFPSLTYQNTFIRDFNREKSARERLKLQETLAKVERLLKEHSGATAGLSTDGGLQYNRYTNIPGKIAHFNVDVGRRVSCQVGENGLMLRHYGQHDYVNDNP